MHEEQTIDRRNYDIVSLNRQGREKRESYVQDALRIDPLKVKMAGTFVKVFADMFLKKEVAVNSRAYF
jgi:hypothetical protein